MNKHDEDFSADPILDQGVVNPDPDETPPDVEEFLAGLGIEKKQYTCVVTQWPVEGGGQPIYITPTYKAKYPSIDEIGIEFGPGKYTYHFKWRIRNDQGTGYKPTMKTLDIKLGHQWADKHEEYLYQQKIERRKRLQRMRDNAEADSILYAAEKFNANAPQGDGMNEVDKLKAYGRTLMELTSLTAPTPAKSDNAMIPMMMQMMQMASNQQQDTMKFMMTLMQANQNSNTQLMTAMIQGNAGKPVHNQLKEVIETVGGIVDMKQMLNPEKETVVDKIFNTVNIVASQIPALIKKSPEEREKDSIMQIARASQEYKDLQNDQAMTDALAAKLDSHYGVEQTNNIMAVMDLDRSPEMKATMQAQGQSPDPTMDSARQTAEGVMNDPDPAGENENDEMDID